MGAGILVVEQYADLRFAIRSALSRQRYSCDCVATEEDAIARLVQNRYSAILLAPVIPLTDDPVLRFLQIHQPEEVPKLILMCDPEVQADAYRHLVKPFGDEQLLRELRPPGQRIIRIR